MKNQHSCPKKTDINYIFFKVQYPLVDNGKCVIGYHISRPFIFRKPMKIFLLYIIECYLIITIAYNNASHDYISRLFVHSKCRSKSDLYYSSTMLSIQVTFCL